MILNLSRHFIFDRKDDHYDVAYQFTKDKTESATASNVCLTMQVSLNQAATKILQLTKPTATLFQSNELIEKMIEEEMVTFCAV